MARDITDSFKNSEFIQLENNCFMKIEWVKPEKNQIDSIEFLTYNYQKVSDYEPNDKTKTVQNDGKLTFSLYTTVSHLEEIKMNEQQEGESSKENTNNSRMAYGRKEMTQTQKFLGKLQFSFKDSESEDF